MVMVRIRTAWWVRWYLSSVVTFANLTGMEPDGEKVVHMVSKGLTVEVVPCSGAAVLCS